MFFVFLVLIVCSFWQLTLLLFFHDYFDFIYFVRMNSYTINFNFLFNILRRLLLILSFHFSIFLSVFFRQKQFVRLPLSNQDLVVFQHTCTSKDQLSNFLCSLFLFMSLSLSCSSSLQQLRERRELMRSYLAIILFCFKQILWFLWIVIDRHIG